MRWSFTWPCRGVSTWLEDIRKRRRPTGATGFGRVGAIKGGLQRGARRRCIRDGVQDIRYALRSFARNPAFVFTVSGTIALGLGLNLALFTLFNAYVLRPLSVNDPYSLYSFTWSDRREHEHGFSWDEYQELAKEKSCVSRCRRGSGSVHTDRRSSLPGTTGHW